MESHDRIKEINHYLGIKELICAKCGSILHINEVEVETSITKRNKAIFWAICPECGNKIRRLRNSKIDRVFWRGDMHNIADVETSLLIWMMNVGYIKDEKLISAIRHHLKGRIVTNKTIEPMSIKEQQEITLNKELRGLKSRLSELEKTVAMERHEMLANAGTWDAVRMAEFQRKAKKLNKLINLVKIDIDEKELELVKIDG